MSDFKLLDEWYKAVIAAGAVIAVPAITVGHRPALICAIGLLLFGVGEFINHPFRSRIIQDGWVRGVASGRARDPKPFGVLLDVVGLALFAWGVVLLLIGEKLDAQPLG